MLLALSSARRWLNTPRGILFAGGGLSFLAYLWLGFQSSLVDSLSLYLPIHLALFVLLVTIWRLLLEQERVGHLVSMPTILVFSLLFRLPMLPSDASLSDDIYRYIWDGKVQMAHINPYRYPPEAAELFELRDDFYDRINHPHVPTIYPPTSQIVFRALASVAPAEFGFKLGFALIEMGAIFLLCFVLRSSGLGIASVLLYAWNPLVVVETSSSGHSECIAIVFLVLGLLFLQKDRRILAGAALGLSVLAKIFPAFCAPAWLSSIRRKGILGALAVVTGLTFLFWTGDIDLLVGLGTFAEHWNHNEFFYRVLFWTTPNRDVAKLVAAFMVLGASVLAIRRVKSPSLVSLCEGSLWLLFLLLSLSPTVHPWYVGWLSVWLAVTPRWAPLVWCGTVPLTYEILPRFRQSGEWQENPWIVALEYIPVLVALAVDLRDVWSGRGLSSDRYTAVGES